MNIEEAIKTALDYEHKVTDVYNTYADQFKSKVGKKIFKTLGREEDEHVAYLEAKLNEWKQKGKVTIGKLETVVPDQEKIKKNVKKLKKIAKQDGLEKEIEFFKKALEMETKTSAFYKKMVAQLPAGQRELFQRFIEIEEGHEAIVKAEIDAAVGLGYWFDFEEFDLEVA